MLSDRVNMRLVAERARVSTATVSRVLNNNPNVKPELRRSVEAAVRDLQYSFRSPLRKLAYDAVRIGLVIPSITDPFYPSVLAGVTHAALGQNVEIVLCDSMRDPRLESQHIRFLLNRGVRGILISTTSSELDSELARRIEERFPIVFLLDREFDREDISSVSTDNVEGAYQAAKYLLDLGHRDLLCLCLPASSTVSSWRRRGLTNALASVGLPRDGERFRICDSGYEDAYRVVAEFKRGSAVRFTAICALSDSMALGAWRALLDLGYRIPEDYSILGYDDLPFSVLASLTTVAEPRIEIGKNALTLLLDLIAGRREPPQRIMLRNSLIIRNSCRRI